MQRILLILSVILMAGCIATTKRLNKVKLGMSREEVIQVMGQPESILPSLQGEILRYELHESINDWYPAPYYIYISNGKVKRFGRMGIGQENN